MPCSLLSAQSPCLLLTLSCSSLPNGIAVLISSDPVQALSCLRTFPCSGNAPRIRPWLFNPAEQPFRHLSLLTPQLCLPPSCCTFGHLPPTHPLCSWTSNTQFLKPTPGKPLPFTPCPSDQGSVRSLRPHHFSGTASLSLLFFSCKLNTSDYISPQSALGCGYLCASLIFFTSLRIHGKQRQETSLLSSPRHPTPFMADEDCRIFVNGWCPVS